MESIELDVSRIRVSPFNTRKNLTYGDEGATIENLARTIRDQGLLEPIIVRPTPDGQYEVVAGQRRLRAVQLLRWSTISAVVKHNLSDAEAMEISLAENIHHADMHPLDKAQGYKDLFKKYGSVKLVADFVSTTPPTIYTYLYLLDLAPAIQGSMTAPGKPASIKTLSELGRVFDQAIKDQAKVLNLIHGEKAYIQQWIIRESDGNVRLVPELIEKAREKFLGIYRCRELLCTLMPEAMKARVRAELRSMDLL